MRICIALALRLTVLRGSELRPMPPSTFENLLILYARRFPIRRGKLRVINLLWRAAVGEPEHASCGGLEAWRIQDVV